MRSLWRLALTTAAAIGFAILLALPAAVVGAVADEGDCFAVARQGNGELHTGTGRSLQQAKAEAMSICTKVARYPGKCAIVRVHCDIAPESAAASNHPFIDGLRQTKVPVNWTSGLVAAAIHLIWIWHIVSQKTLGVPEKAGLGLGVPVVQAILAYALGSDGEVGLLELPIFALPLGLGEFVASISLKRHSDKAAT
ncbi:hypothetical protein [Bradyrhizobium canariense]|uniref:DUF4189 domain-containing protein n=1 Tax=Bradyrhizobium canariense TaxID=255045 RepID=A0A1H2BT40_9BRAD|nr:hypothetical protein [Bradyrhizobium canariense]SDT61411.1 hypothetical protein SAMN05444158_7512 [Bradyrhizobium canariense]